MVSADKITSRDVSVYHKLNKAVLLERARDLMRIRLMECGWRDKVKLECRKILKEKSTDGAVVSVNDLVKHVVPKARSLVPDSVKKEILQQLSQMNST